MNTTATNFYEVQSHGVTTQITPDYEEALSCYKLSMVNKSFLRIYSLNSSTGFKTRIL